MVESERKMKKEVKEENNNNPGIVSVLIQMWDLCSIRLCLTMSILMARFAIPILTECRGCKYYVQMNVFILI